MAHDIRNVTRKALTAMLASLGFTAYSSCTDEPDLYGAPLPEDTTRVDIGYRPMYGTVTRAYVHNIDK